MKSMFSFKPSFAFSGYDDVDFSFVSWMDRFWFKMLEDKVNPKDVYAGTLINCIENIKHGYTTTSDTTEGSYALPGALFGVQKLIHVAAMEK